MNFLRKLKENWKKKREAKKAIRQLESKEEKNKQEQLNEDYKLRTARDYLKAKNLVDKIYKERRFEKADSPHTMAYKEKEIPIQAEERTELNSEVKKELEKRQIGSYILTGKGIFIKTPFGVKKVKEMDKKPSYIQKLLDDSASTDKKKQEKAINKLIELALR